MNESLQKAIDCLSIRDVYLRSSESTIAEEFEPKYEADFEDLDVKIKHIVTQSSVLHLELDDEEPQQLFRVFVELGVLWTDPESETDDDSEPEDVKAKIEAVMVAEYRMEEDPGPEALKEFALNNASFHPHR